MILAASFALVLALVAFVALAFFLLHGVAVAATARMRPTGWRAALGVGLTLAFTLATLVLFTASLDATLAPLTPFYELGRPGLWAD